MHQDTPTLLRITAYRYIAAKKAVVEKWQPLCGCDRPFEYPHCQTCPSHVEFKQRLREEIERLAI